MIIKYIINRLSLVMKEYIYMNTYIYYLLMMIFFVKKLK